MRKVSPQGTRVNENEQEEKFTPRSVFLRPQQCEIAHEIQSNRRRTHRRKDQPVLYVGSCVSVWPLPHTVTFLHCRSSEVDGDMVS